MITFLDSIQDKVAQHSGLLTLQVIITMAHGRPSRCILVEASRAQVTYAPLRVEIEGYSTLGSI